MPECYNNEGDIKRKIRNLKKMEMKLRFHQYDTGMEGKSREMCKFPGKAMVWDEFFCLQDNNCRRARYSIKDLLAMDREGIKKVVGQYYYAVYYKIFQETGILDNSLYNPDILMKMGLPFDADAGAVKKRFRELAKEYHPDAGGNSEKFMELLEQMDSLHFKG